MTERNIAAEVLTGLKEVREQRAGKLALRQIRTDMTSLPELDPNVIRRIRANFGELAETNSQPSSVSRDSSPDLGSENGNFTINRLTLGLK